MRKAPAYTRMSSCAVAFENRACQVSLEMELRVGYTCSISAAYRHPLLAAAGWRRIRPAQGAVGHDPFSPREFVYRIWDTGAFVGKKIHP
jgi:hypothetical protein